MPARVPDPYRALARASLTVNTETGEPLPVYSGLRSQPFLFIFFPGLGAVPPFRPRLR
jgi:hypothetical protein